MKFMKKAGILILVSFLTVIVINAQQRYEADPVSTVIEWKGEKIIGSDHMGTINLKSGWLDIEGNAITAGEFIIDMNSINNTDLKDENMKRRLEGHLKSDDFFGVDKYPFSRLVITGASAFTEGTSTVRGNLTIKEVTHPAEFTARVMKEGDSHVYTAQITFDRSLYDVRFGSGKFFSNLGDNAIRDEIHLDVRLVVD
jgi:polyisoprenoid-binding protein YceI